MPSNSPSATYDKYMHLPSRQRVWLRYSAILDYRVRSGAAASVMCSTKKKKRTTVAVRNILNRFGSSSHPNDGKNKSRSFSLKKSSQQQQQQQQQSQSSRSYDHYAADPLDVSRQSLGSTAVGGGVYLAGSEERPKKSTLRPKSDRYKNKNKNSRNDKSLHVPSSSSCRKNAQLDIDSSIATASTHQVDLDIIGTSASSAPSVSCYEASTPLTQPTSEPSETTSPVRAAAVAEQQPQAESQQDQQSPPGTPTRSNASAGASFATSPTSSSQYIDGGGTTEIPSPFFLPVPAAAHAPTSSAAASSCSTSMYAYEQPSIQAQQLVSEAGYHFFVPHPHILSLNYQQQEDEQDIQQVDVLNRKDVPQPQYEHQQQQHQGYPPLHRTRSSSQSSRSQISPPRSRRSSRSQSRRSRTRSSSDDDTAVQMQAARREALMAQAKLFGSQHPDTLFAMHSIQTMYDRQGRHDLSLELEGEARRLSNDATEDEDEEADSEECTPIKDVAVPSSISTDAIPLTPPTKSIENSIATPAATTRLGRPQRQNSIVSRSA